MRGTFIEARTFTESVTFYFWDDTDYQEFQVYLLESPDRGDVIQGCGGLRKVRWRHKKRGKGSRSGLRIVYLHIPEVSQFLLLDVYSKDEAEDLSREERRFLADLAQEYRTAAIAKARRQRRTK